MGDPLGKMFPSTQLHPLRRLVPVVDRAKDTRSAGNGRTTVTKIGDHFSLGYVRACILYVYKTSKGSFI